MQQDFTLAAYDFALPKENIAQFPADRREDSRLLVLDRATGCRRHLRFAQIGELLQPGDLLVVNDTRVFPARLLGRKESGGKAEVFLLSFPEETGSVGEENRGTAVALLKGSKRSRPGTRIRINEDLSCTVLELIEGGKAQVELRYPADREIGEILAECGLIPLPPYIERQAGSTDTDRHRYQTVYADRPGAVAAPTAGLHFSQELLAALAAQGVESAPVTLHVGYGTFAPVRTEAIQEHRIHREWLEIAEATAQRINQTKERGGKIWAVGTTSVRALEFAAQPDGRVRATEGWCDLYILPGYPFRVVDHLITNFHLPQSSLLFLVAALCGRETLLACYQEAIRAGYRFYSYGDAMAIL